MIDKQKRQRLAAFVLAAQVHSRDVDLALAENGSDASDDAGLVVVREEDHVAARHNFKRIAVNVHNARKLVREYRSRYPMRFDVRLELDDDEVCKIFGSREARLLNLDPALLCTLVIRPFKGHGRQASRDRAALRALDR